MEQTQYLVVGSSHAALEAITAIRMHDPDGTLMLLTRDAHLPYSPTVLPYVVSGRSAPDNVFLRDTAFFEHNRVNVRLGVALRKLDTERNVAELADGVEIGYAKVVLATGASPAIPPIPGIDAVPYHVLRTLDDATRLRDAMQRSRQAVVLGAGLVGMHAAENLVKAGANVTIVEMSAQLTSGYFDETAASLIEQAFTENGAKIRTSSRVVRLERAGDDEIVLTLEDGTTLHADLLLVATGVRPELGYLEGSGVACDKGILVDDTMRTNIDNVWAAGDCAQARGFFDDAPIMNAILPDATVQGRIAGMAMAGDPGLKPYAGGVPLNTYHFFGRHAISVGSSKVPEGGEERTRFDADSGRHLKLIMKDGRLLGIYGVNEFFDAGVMAQLITRRTDLSAVKDRLFEQPLTVGRELMSQIWR
ncbi:MAG TPA: FAD-dependent oxidoreductase [Rhodocyclaceae bacterium]|jgi:phenylglyoxylate dehydrogenase epsilon subunit|nr:FAD-dependent oxidoreductase [Rhodocyclaceae bacterium]HRQ47431.1 FAD-dependent oxidoreductase [Rhodocyclaceae bacterium]